MAILRPEKKKKKQKRKKKNNNINKVPDSSIHLILIIFYRKAFEICWYTKKTKKNALKYFYFSTSTFLKNLQR